MKNSATLNIIIRWIIFLPIAIFSTYLLQIVEVYLDGLAVFYDNFIFRYLIAFSYSFLNPIVAVAVGVTIVPSNKVLVGKIMSILLFCLFVFLIYHLSTNRYADNDFFTYIPLSISLVGSIVAYFSSKQDRK